MHTVSDMVLKNRIIYNTTRYTQYFKNHCGILGILIIVFIKIKEYTNSHWN